MNDERAHSETSGLEIAIVGMALRFPGANDADEFWQNLVGGVESLLPFADAELLAEGVSPVILSHPNYVKVGASLKDNPLVFDAHFFGIAPKEAAMMDPQQRLFLQCAWEALEDAGYDPDTFPGQIGIIGGMGKSYYYERRIKPSRVIEEMGHLQTRIGHEKDFLTTKAAYKLNLTGPAITIQTGCSTALVATHLGCQSLLTGECDIVLAGGVRIKPNLGYLYTPDATGSPDGRCRAFDAKGQGPGSGSGVGIVVLKRLDDALADRDHVYAVIKGSAVNNDGASRVGFTAPSVEGQVKVIRAALATAGVMADTITYVETHGTGTPLGDPVEISALTQAFRSSTDRKGFCAVGSVKTNVGHLGDAAGSASLIKAALALKHQQIPPSLNFEEPNPNIDFENSAFFVNTALRPWLTDSRIPRRSGVSAFGIGGTNAHVILEEAPPLPSTQSARPAHLLLLSAATPTALETMTDNLVAYLEKSPAVNIADVAYTLRVGRKHMEHRGMLVCQDREQAIAKLRARDPGHSQYVPKTSRRPMAWMFPGIGDHYVNMAKGLFDHEPTFRDTIAQCADYLAPYLDKDLRDILFSQEEGSTNGQGPFDLRKMLSRGQASPGATRLDQTYLAQPVVFAIEYALAQLLLSWGIQPEAMIGYSLGEYVAACLAGVFSLDEALMLVAERARLIQTLPAGAMLSVPLAEEEIRHLMGPQLSVAVVNGPKLCVVSGAVEAIAELAQRLQGQGVACSRLPITHAFHSALMQPLSEAFTRLVQRVNLQPPRIPYVSNVTGTWITAEQATEPTYWARHMCETVRFADGIRTLLQEPQRILLEVGAGRTLSSFALLHLDRTDEQLIVSSLPHSYENESDIASLLRGIGRLWLAGVPIDWQAFGSHDRGNRLSLPTYPFEGQVYNLEIPATEGNTEASPIRASKKVNLSSWFHVPAWKRTLPPSPVEPGALAGHIRRWLLFVDNEIGSQLAKRLREQEGQDVIVVRMGDGFRRVEEGLYTIAPHSPQDYVALCSALSESIPAKIVHLWGITTEPERDFAESQYRGYYSLLFLAQALEHTNLLRAFSAAEPLHIEVFVNDLHDVLCNTTINPAKATVLGPVKVMPQEYPQVACRCFDILPDQACGLLGALLAEMVQVEAEPIIAYRDRQRWVQAYEPISLPEKPAASLRHKGTYLITGGLGHVGLQLAEYMAQAVQARVVLLGRSPFPAKADWAQWLDSHPTGDETSGKIRRLQALEEGGAEILVLQADVADAHQMQAAIRQIDNHYGTLHGVIHAAAITHGKAIFGSIAEIGAVESELQFHAKIHGVYTLASVFHDRPLDFCVLFSSNAAILGGLSFTAYAAANSFMDAFATRHSRDEGAPWLSVNWDGWSREGAEEHRYAMSREEAIVAFERVLAGVALGQIVVSTGDLTTRINTWLKREGPLSQRQNQNGDHGVQPTTQSRLHRTSVAPSNEVEQVVADIWHEVLGVESVGLDENFFDLGGHSLLATQIVVRLNRIFRVNVSIQGLFESPTVAGIAKMVVEHEPTPGQTMKIAQLLKQIEAMPQDKVRELIRNKTGSTA